VAYGLGNRIAEPGLRHVVQRDPARRVRTRDGALA
jgi:hypothetical protein